MKNCYLISTLLLSTALFAAGVEVNGDFETGDALGWTEWSAA